MPKKREPHHAAHHAVYHHSPQNLEEKILQSIIDLQKVHVSVAEKFDKLSEQIASLLALFELAARSFAKQPGMQSTEKDKEFLAKIDQLLDQNKVLAKGLTLMEEKLKERVYGPGMRYMPARPSPQPQQFRPVQEI